MQKVYQMLFVLLLSHQLVTAQSHLDEILPIRGLSIAAPDS